jgi:hypothetical protein
VRTCLALGFAVLILGGCGGNGSDTDSPNFLQKATSRVLLRLGLQKEAPPNIIGRWVVQRSVKSGHGQKVPSNFRLIVEYDLEAPKNLVPARDSVVAYRRETTDRALVEFGKEGEFRDPSALVVGDGLYVLEDDSVRITGPKGSLVFALVQSPQLEYALGDSTLILPKSAELTWSGKDSNQTRMWMMRPGAAGPQLR